MIIKSPAYLFLAKNVIQITQDTDRKEIREVFKVPFEKAYQMVLGNEITHGASCVGILKVRELLKT